MSSMWSWFILFIAGILEIGWAISLRYSDGFTKIIPSALTALILAIGMYLLAKASQVLPLGTAYAVWVGIGVLGTTIAGMVLFNEAFSTSRVLFLIVLLISIVGLKVSA